MIRILIVDDQNLVQQGIKSLLDRDLDFKVIGTVKDGRNAIHQIAQIHPDIVLLDIEMPGMDGITATKYIYRVSPKTKVIILSSHEEKKYVTRALMAGARGYILKTSLMTDLKQAILAVNNGYSQIDSRLLAKVFDPQSVKTKKSDLESKSDVNLVTQDNLISQNSQKSLSHKNSSAIKETKSEYDNSVDSLEHMSIKSFLGTEEAEIYEPAISESNTSIQPETTEWKTKGKAFSNNASDSVVLKQVNPKEEIAQLTKSNEHQKLSPRISPPMAVKTLKKQPIKEKSKQYKVKLPSPIQPKQKRNLRNLYWKILLVILGIVVVVILGS